MQDAFAEAEEVRPEPPRPLTRDTPPADPFPVDPLGDVLGPAARAINDRVQAPIAMCGQSVIAVVALAVQGHANVLLPIGPQGQARPLSCYFVSVASTGERKSACDREAMWPVGRREMALREEHDRAAPDYQNDRLAWEKARDAAVKKGKGDRASIKAELDRIGPAPNCSSPVLRPKVCKGLDCRHSAGRPGRSYAPKAVVLHDLDLQLTTYFQTRSKYALPINLKDLRRTMPL